MYVQELLHNQTLTQIGVQVNLSLRRVTQNTDKDYENGNVYCLSVKLWLNHWTMYRSTLNWCRIAINPQRKEEQHSNMIWTGAAVSANNKL